VKPRLTLEVVVTGGSPGPIPWGDWGQAMMLELRYTHPRQNIPITIRQAVRVRREPNDFYLRVGCWGVMPSGMLRHPLFVR
jgi:hypothetical protein